MREGGRESRRVPGVAAAYRCLEGTARGKTKRSRFYGATVAQ